MIGRVRVEKWIRELSNKLITELKGNFPFISRETSLPEPELSLPAVHDRGRCDCGLLASFHPLELALQFAAAAAAWQRTGYVRAWTPRCHGSCSSDISYFAEQGFTSAVLLEGTIFSQRHKQNFQKCLPTQEGLILMALSCRIQASAYNRGGSSGGAHLIVGSSSFKGGGHWLGSVASLGHSFSGMLSSALC